MRVLLCLPAVLLAVATAASAGPFGLSLGQDLESLQSEEVSSQDFYYRLKSVPKPHSSFDAYYATVSPGQGLCRILAFTPNTENDRFGNEAKDTFEAVSGQLSNVYGESDFFDTLAPGSLWDEPGNWSMSVYTNDRSYVEFWSEETGAVLKDDIEGISLRASALRADATYLVLEYQFKNFANCAAERNAKDESAL